MLTQQNTNRLNQILGRLTIQARTSWHAKMKLEHFWGEASDNYSGDGENSGEAPYGH